MTVLRSFIESIPPERVAFVFQGKQLSYGDLVLMTKKNESVIETLKGASIAIKARSRSELAVLLPMLDGVVNRILLLAPDISEDLYERFYKEAKITYEVFCNSDNLNIIPVAGPHNQHVSSSSVTEWIIPTSGTTNIPKLVSHTLSSLSASSKIDIQSGNRYVWGLVYDIYRFAGLQVYLQSTLSGSTLIIPDESKDLIGVINVLSRGMCNSLSGTPSFWRKLLMHGDSNSFNFLNITLGGEISDDTILKALIQKFPKSRIRHVYASTEAGVGFSVTDGKSGFPQKYLNEGVNGVKLKINSDNILCIKPKTKDQKYINNQQIFQDDGYIATGDLVTVRDNRVYFLGRDSGAINVGGNKVHPEEVEHVLLLDPTVKAAKVYSKPNPILGSLVCAEIVADTPDFNKIKSDLIKLCKMHLAAYKVPVSIKTVNVIDVNDSGKIKRG
ncbi:acyl--CoA ligase [Sansalvadorimonas sp. 2012CJ34-2]|uniref:Acyl--CoA ligase n=1 Tax=Parendozoicomonas callyspongiae TaxID=2942213 RepID=A0ABT0PLM9_9GAMM|nr:class I adenylate-forming enzyme family protein [Sansalvadorimonas sp. 2012CJ34-2]MCL6271886.1 acyl--CoA ligase [Sansalvadorimonas sp. 2012CJ34-2]